MFDGNYRRVIAASMLAICLMLAVPQTAEARLPEPGQRGQIEMSLDGELGFWEKILQIFDAAWSKASVMIIPD